MIEVITKEELKELIRKTIEERGLECDLNFIDTSLIADMSYLFQDTNFNGDISQWDVGNVTNTDSMFWNSEFNGDISKWNVSNVRDMKFMFSRSKFNRDISNWNVSNVKNMNGMFAYSKFNQDISQWNVENVKEEYGRFSGGSQRENNLPPRFRNPLDQCKSYIGWKKLKDDRICKLFIPEDAIKLKGASSKCRTNKARVLIIEDGALGFSIKGYSIYNSDFIYKAGKEVKPDEFDLDIGCDCSNGIHFFLTREEAINYDYKSSCICKN